MENVTGQGFHELTINEQSEINGGVFPIIPVILGAATILGGYACVREIARDKGRADAYRDGYGRKK